MAETGKNVAVGTTVGAVVGVVAVTGVFLAIGLTPAGPIAGMWFASNMGAGLASGSAMALVQSAAMTTGAYYAGAGVGGAVGGATGYFSGAAKQAPPDPNTVVIADGQPGDEENDAENENANRNGNDEANNDPATV